MRTANLRPVELRDPASMLFAYRYQLTMRDLYNVTCCACLPLYNPPPIHHGETPSISHYALYISFDPGISRAMLRLSYRALDLLLTPI